MTTLTRLPAVETPSLIVREIEFRDAEAFCGFMMQDSYQRHISLRLSSEAEVKAFVSRSVVRQGDERRNVFHLAAEEKMSGEAIGDGFLIVQRPKTLEIGWGLHPAMWRMGLGTEIGEALLGLAFERLKAERVWCKVMSPNRASAKLARRIGMRPLPSQPDVPVSASQTGNVDFYAIAAEAYFERTYS